ncbi:MAG: metal ABC transporter permease [Kiritimatiellae bacterium]|nr:metal ABC transporter permease [Kiritimatiellia bacterium]
MTELIATFGFPFLACLLMTGILGYMGLHVLKREIVFIDIAVAQVSAFGAITAHMFFHAHGDSLVATVCALGSTLVAALFFAIVRRRMPVLPIEATIGIVYALAAAGALFMIGKSTGGHTHIMRMLTGSLLWVNLRDIGWAALAFGLVGMCFRLFRKPLQQISDNYDNASIDGLNVVAWDFFFYALCGVVITMAVRLAGVVVVFCFLIIPATISALFSSKWGTRLLITWIAGVLGSIAGLIFCWLMDFSAGVSVALFLGVLLILLSVAKWIWDLMRVRVKL